jgi:hypothetical protein
MTDQPSDFRTPAAARAHAAALFTAAARSEHDLTPGCRLRCLAAADALGHQGVPPTEDGNQDPDLLIRSALTILGTLPLHEFAATDVRDSTEHARRALRELR